MLRLLRFPLVRFVVTMVLFGALAVPLILLLSKAHVESDIAYELVGAASLLAAVFLVTRFVERRPFLATFYPPALAFRDLVSGFGVGAALVVAVIAMLATLGAYSEAGLSTRQPIRAVVDGILFFFIVAVFEETLFRGVIFRLFEETFGTITAIFVSASLFGAAHYMQPHATWTAAVAIGLEAGVLLDALFLQRRSLWIPVGVHWAWNLFLGPIFGAPVSGTMRDHLLAGHLAGSNLLTGGEFGPEAGVVTVVVCGAAGATFLARARRAGSFVAPMWRRPRARPQT
jgi:uncharacterized protein